MKLIKIPNIKAKKGRPLLATKDKVTSKQWITLAQKELIAAKKYLWWLAEMDEDDEALRLVKDIRKLLAKTITDEA